MLWCVSTINLVHPWQGCPPKHTLKVCDKHLDEGLNLIHSKITKYQNHKLLLLTTVNSCLNRPVYHLEIHI